ncbi:NADH-quinone oxidoreductase subunit [Trichinella pseudospiralis]
MGLESSTPRVRNMRLCSRKCAKWNKFSATKYILLCTSFHAFGIGINAFVSPQIIFLGWNGYCKKHLFQPENPDQLP